MIRAITRGEGPPRDADRHFNHSPLCWFIESFPRDLGWFEVAD